MTDAVAAARTELGVLAGLGRHGWDRRTSAPARSGAAAPRTTYTRPLGVLEAKFDMAAREEGLSDIFLQFDIELAQPRARDAFARRLVPAWATLRARHPLLASAIHTGEEREDSLPGGRVLRYAPPHSVEDALQDARDTILVGELGTMGSILAEKVLNGPRVLLQQDLCLARILIFSDAAKPSSMGFMLVIAHAISDGLSIFTLTNELFTLLAAPTLPTPSSAPTLCTIPDFLSGHVSQIDSWDESRSTLAAWDVLAPSGDLSSTLPVASESIYLAGLPGSNVGTVPTDSVPKYNPTGSEETTLPRKRWFWAISRALLLVHNRRTPRTAALPRITRDGPPVQPNTEWVPLKFSRAHTSSILALCKANAISPSMLSYSILAMAISNVINRLDPASPYQPVLIGFPMSLRRFLGTPSALSDLAIRITFGSIHLPRFPLEPTSDNFAALRFTALQGARLASRQFAIRLDPAPHARNQFLAASYYLIMDRLLTSHSLNAFPLDEARGAMNASMVGHLDRVLPRAFNLPTTPPVPTGSTLRLSNVLLGTRLHRGEGMLMEAFTWDEQLTFCLGFDDFVVEPSLVRAILSEVEQVGTVLAEGSAKA